MKSSAKTDENERETRLTLNKLPVLSISAAPVTAGHHVDPGWLSHLHSEQSLDYATIYLCHILNDGKNGFPVLCTVPRRVQKIKFKRTSGNKRKLSNVKDYLHIFCRGKDVEKRKARKILKQISVSPMFLQALVSKFSDNRFWCNITGNSVVVFSTLNKSV